MTPFRIDLEAWEGTPRQRLARGVALSQTSCSRAGYYILLFQRWVSIFGRDAIWFGPNNDDGVNHERLLAAYEQCAKMMTAHENNAFRKYTLPTLFGWVKGQKIFIEYSQKATLRMMAENYRRSERRAKWAKDTSKRLRQR